MQRELGRLAGTGRKRKAIVNAPGQPKQASWGGRPAVLNAAKGLFSTILTKTRSSLPHGSLLFSTFAVTNVARGGDGVLVGAET